MATLALGAPYRRLLSATLLSNLGDGIRAAAFPLLAATLTRNPILISGVAIARPNCAANSRGANPPLDEVKRQHSDRGASAIVPKAGSA